MKLKYSFLILVAGAFASCLKPKNDFGGLRTDAGSILTSITESQYLNVNKQNGGLKITAFASFNFNTPATEDVKFFTLHIAQPRDVKVSGSLLVKVTMTAHPGSPDPNTGAARTFTLPPAGAITIPTEISIPAPPSSYASYDFPVKFTVNKALLNPATWYGAEFTITSVNQGSYSELDKKVDVIFNNKFPASGVFTNTSKYSGRYQWTSTVSDPAGQYGTTNNTKPVTLEENIPNNLDIFDFGAWGHSSATTYRYLWANNFSTGASTALFAPRYVLDAAGKITSITNASGTAAVTNITLDPSGANQFTYTSNDQRSFSVKYSFSYTSTINGTNVTRTISVVENFAYDLVQTYS